MIGDVDPEDVYDASDPVSVRLSALALIVRSLDNDADLSRRARRRADVVRLLRNVTADVADG